MNNSRPSTAIKDTYSPDHQESVKDAILFLIYADEAKYKDNFKNL